MIILTIYYIDRKTGKKEKETVAGEKFLRWINDTKMGNSILETFVRKKLFSILYGKLQDLSISKKKIPGFINALDIDMSEAVKESHDMYSNFNDFFARRLKDDTRPINKDNNILISPADGRVFAYENIDINKVLQIKGSHYSLEELLQSKSLASKYENGTCIVIRLCPADYHRFHFPDGGVAEKSKFIDGYYYSVNPMTLRKFTEVYCRNKREITVFKSNNFGEVLLIEVGATCVGSIIQTYEPNIKVNKGDEKGYFKFGGSTVIMFIKKGQVKIDRDIIENTKNHIETKINMGEGIGKK
ncbi:phosphatidylserine decarboxylase [Dethiothermospora halolimnae]|uniref:phosphatidylserine decarboxylase n=1 Tax=Dethiothermospora halolimnae TaxID=3114390 RepID=UPI003CCBBD3A